MKLINKSSGGFAFYRLTDHMGQLVGHKTGQLDVNPKTNQIYDKNKKPPERDRGCWVEVLDGNW